MALNDIQLLAILYCFFQTIMWCVLMENQTAKQRHKNLNN